MAAMQPVIFDICLNVRIGFPRPIGAQNANPSFSSRRKKCGRRFLATVRADF